MKFFLVLVLCIGTAFSMSPVCNECQETAQRFQNAAQNPSQMNVMKKMLTHMCPGSKYEEECKILISRLDVLVGYMGTPNSFCNMLNMCSNSRIDGLNHVGLLFAKKFMNMIDGKKENVCNECQVASDEILKELNGQTQAQLQHFISGNLCANMKEYQKTCDNMLNTFLPTVYGELQDSLADSKQFCQDLRLCSAKQVNHRMNANEVKSKMMGPKYVENLIKSYQAIKLPNNLDDSSMSCAQCEMMIDIVLDQLKTTSANTMLVGIVNMTLCGVVLPSEWGCNDFVQTYGSTIVYMTVLQFDSTSMCTDFKQCPNDTTTNYKSNKNAIQQKCSNCETLSSFLSTEMTKPKAKTEIIYGLQHMACQDAPHSLHNVCETFVGGLLPNAYDKFLYYLQNKTVCKTLQAC